MGRRKIEIKAIKDDRNRSVTFLKRKGGLFKKAHELSVLCSVDVAVIIFGQNKKLYQYSSGDIQQTITRHQYYGQPHEHKGPSDFQGKGANDDEDEDDDNPASPDQSPPHHHAMPPAPHVLQAQPGMHHVTHRTPQNSPPLNGSFGSRVASPQPHHLSRPASRTHVRRVSSNLVPQNHPHPHAAQPTTQPPQYGYSQGAPFYTQGPPPPAIQVQGRQQGTPPMPHQHHFPHQQNPPNAQMQHLYLQEQGRRQSMPPNFPMQDQEQRQLQVNTQPMAQHQFRSPQPQPRVLERHNQSHSIFTPVDDDRSILAQRFGLGGGTEAMQRESAVRPDMGPRSNSADGNALRININGQSPRNQFAPPPSNQNMQVHQRSGSVQDFGPPPRTPSFQAPQGKRPSLKVQIPSEQSESESATAGSSSKDGQQPNQITTPIRAKAEGGTGIVLPAPSPRSASAGAVLSAGATGPANPFARPPLPHQTFGNRDSDNVQTPASALPSRMMGDLMNSPSNFWSNSEWGLGSFGGNSLVSPAAYQPTPVQTSNPPFREGSIEKRRNSSEEPSGGPPKRAKA